MGKEHWQVFTLLAVILVAVFFFDLSTTDTSSVSGNLARSSRLGAAQTNTPTSPLTIPPPLQAPVTPNPSPLPAPVIPPLPAPVIPYCKSLDVTAVIAQRLGLSPNSFYIDMELLDSRYFTVFLYSYTSSKYELYLYDVGSDGIFNTPDDNGFLISRNSLFNKYTPSLFATLTGQDLFWIEYSTVPQSFDINRCTLTTNGCTNTKTVTTVAVGGTFYGIVTSSSQNRLYLAYNDIPYTKLIYDSCSLLSAAVDDCAYGQAYFTNRVTFPFPQFSFVRTLPNIGFIQLDNYANQVSFFNIYLPSSNSNMLLPKGVDAFSLSTRLGTQLLGIQNLTGGGIYYLVTINSLTGLVIAKIDAFQANHFYLIGVTNRGIVSVYSDLNYKLMEKKVSSSAIPLYSDQQYVTPKIVLPDARVLGSNDGFSVFLSLCIP